METKSSEDGRWEIYFFKANLNGHKRNPLIQWNAFVNAQFAYDIPADHHSVQLRKVTTTLPKDDYEFT